jgi:hypothetical protein
MGPKAALALSSPMNTWKAASRVKKSPSGHQKVTASPGLAWRVHLSPMPSPS